MPVLLPLEGIVADEFLKISEEAKVDKGTVNKALELTSVIKSNNYKEVCE